VVRLVSQSDIYAIRTLASHEANDGVLDNDLFGYSAGEAARYLIAHWSDARASATKVSEFSTQSIDDDLQSTIEALIRFRQAVSRELREPSRKCQHEGCSNRYRNRDVQVIYCGRRDCASVLAATAIRAT
jgi:hypothetical protein